MPKQNVLRASFRNHDLPVRLQSLQVRQEFGKHGLAILDYRFQEKRQYILPKSETPAAIQWGQTPLGTKTFYGYVNHYDTEAEGADTSTQMFVLGTSKVLNSSKPTTWHGTTHSSIARDIAKRHRLRSVITPSNRILPAWSTGNRTDFQALNALFSEIGYYPWIDGPTLYFLNPKQILRQAANMTPLRVGRNQVRRSKVTGGMDAPREGYNPVRRRVIYGLDSKTNEFFTATGGDKDKLEVALGAAATTYNEAREVAEAAGFRDDDYFHMSMVMDGSAEVYPGSLVYVESGLQNTDQQGYWFVTNAIHQVSPDDFVTTWNGVRGTDSTPRKARISTVSGARRQAAAVVRRDNLWEAEVQEHVNA